MSLKSSIQHTFYQQALKRKKRTASGNISTMNFSAAKSIAVLTDLSNGLESPDLKAVLHYVETLKKAGKEVSLLGFIPESKVPEGLDFDLFCKKELNWALVPKGPTVDRFLDKAYDMLLCLYPQHNEALDFMATAAAATVKAGLYKGEKALQTDVMVHNKNNDFSKALKQLDEALKMINK